MSPGASFDPEPAGEPPSSGEASHSTEVMGRLEQLHDLFRRRLSTDRVNAKAVDALHAQLEDARRWREHALLKPLFLEMILLLDRIDALVEAKLDEDLISVRDEILEILRRRSVVPTLEDAGEFDPAEHEVLEVEETDDAEMDRRVLSVKRRGYRLEGSVLRPAGIVVARATPTPPS